MFESHYSFSHTTNAKHSLFQDLMRILFFLNKVHTLTQCALSEHSEMKNVQQTKLDKDKLFFIILFYNTYIE